MNFLTKMACRTIGTAGMGMAMYDTYCISKQYAKNGGQKESGEYIAKTYANSRTTENVSYVSNDMRKMTFDIMAENPLPTVWGKIKGGFNGAIYSLANNIGTISFSALALTAKNKYIALTGVIGTALCTAYKILQDGLGIGKHTPMD